MSRMVNPPLHVLIIQVNTGHTNVYLCTSEEAALKQLFGYVRRWWETEIKTDIPETIDLEIVSYYMEEAAESFIITRQWEILDEDDKSVDCYDLEDEDE